MFQPLAAEDAARCIALAAGKEQFHGRTIEIGGPQYLTYNDLVDIIARTCRLRRLKLHLPVSIVAVAVRLMERVLSRPPVTSQQLRMLPLPNIAALNTVEETFGFKPRAMEGNIDYVKRIGSLDGLRIALGSMPAGIRDH